MPTYRLTYSERHGVTFEVDLPNDEAAQNYEPTVEDLESAGREVVGFDLVMVEKLPPVEALPAFRNDGTDEPYLKDA